MLLGIADLDAIELNPRCRAACFAVCVEVEDTRIGRVPEEAIRATLGHDFLESSRRLRSARCRNK